MSFSVNDIQFFYTGGAANGNPQLSLGGLASSVRIAAQTASVPVNVTGATISSVANNAQGIGLLSWSPSTNTLAWQPPGSPTTYSLSGITTNGTYVVGGSDGTLAITVVYASLPTIYKQDSITIANSMQNVFDSVAPLDSLVGATDYRCVFIRNVHPTITANGVKVWVKQETSGPDEVDIGLDPAGVGNGSTTGVPTVIIDENNAPAGVTFSRPLSYATGLLIGTLAPGQGAAFWQRRIVPPNTTGDVAINSSVIAVALTV